MKQVLDVPYFSQYMIPIDKSWQGRACGVTSLAMVLSYYKIKYESIDHLIELGNKLNGYSSEAGGWFHSGLIRIAKCHHTSGWRRHWGLSKSDREFFQKEGLDASDLEGYNSQIESEGIFSLAEAINQGIPPIISIKKNFDGRNGNHLIVITGYEKRGGEILGFYYNDPNSKDVFFKNMYVELIKFQENWNKRAVFITKDE